MRAVKAYARVEFFATLPDDEIAADTAFDDICDAVVARLNEEQIVYVAPQSFSVTDADTEPDE